MKKVLVHWVEMVTLEVPDDCPTNDSGEFNKWIYDHDSIDNYPFSEDGAFVTKVNTRDFEIVQVENV